MSWSTRFESVSLSDIDKHINEFAEKVLSEERAKEQCQKALGLVKLLMAALEGEHFTVIISGHVMPEPGPGDCLDVYAKRIEPKP